MENIFYRILNKKTGLFFVKITNQLQLRNEKCFKVIIWNECGRFFETYDLVKRSYNKIFGGGFEPEFPPEDIEIVKYKFEKV